MMDLDDIPDMPDRDQRLEAILVDAYGQSEELTAFEVYLNDTLDFPFSAEWRDPDEPGHSETVKVTGVSDVDERRGVLLAINRGGKDRRVPAEQLWAKGQNSRNATILDDYRYWVESMYGLTPGYE